MKSIVFVLLIVQSFGLDFDKTKKNLEYEKSFIADLESYIDKQESVLQLLRKKLLNFQVEHADALANPERYFANEINKFLLLKRLTTDTELVVDKTFNVAKDFHQKIDKMKNDIGYPTWDELLASTIEIAKLQKREKYKTEKLAKGIFGKVKSRSGLSTVDCYWIGKHLNSGRVYSLALEWLTEALKRYDEYYDLHQVSAVQILEEIAKSFIGSNRIEEAKKVVEKVLRMNASSEVGKLLKKSTFLNTAIDTNNTQLIRSQRSCHSRHFLLHNIFSCSV